MKILHTSDWHLGITLHNIPLYDLQEHFIHSFVGIAEQYGADAVIIAGDIFDSSVSSSDAIRLYNIAVNELCGRLGLPVIIIAGNHDGAARLASCRTLLEKSGLFITGKLERPVKPVILKNTAIYPLPYFNADEVKVLYPDADIKTYTDAFAAVCDDVAQNMDKSLKSIIVSHAFAGGGQTSESDRSAVLGTAQLVDAQVFAPFDYAALGHLHRPQLIGKNVYYSGSPLKYSVTEASQEKSVILLDTADMSAQRIPVVPMREMRVLKGSYDELAASAVESDDYIHIEVTDTSAGLEMLTFFRGFYPNLISLKGKSADGGDTDSMLTADAVRTMSPTEILDSFFEEIYGYTPEKELKELFEQALNTAGEESGEQ